MKRIAVAVTGHGFGHATRTAEVLRALADLTPGLQFTVSSTAPRRLFERTLAARRSTRAQAYEPGTVQKNCFEVDFSATRAVYRRYLAERPARLATEIEFLAAGGFCGVLADIPALPVAAAAEVGIPTACLWNFTWDWILEPILAGEGQTDPDLARVPELLRADYRRAGLHLRLPFSPRESPLSNVEDVPLVGRTASLTRPATLHKLGIDAADSRPVVLVAMGGWDCRRWQPILVHGCHDFRFIVVGDVPIDVRAETYRLPASLGRDFSFTDLVAASSVVLTKPGYGIASECALNGTPLLGVERRGFREAPELVRDMRALAPLREISLDDFFAGRWEDPLESMLGDGWRPAAGGKLPAADGARRVAERLRRFFEL